MESNDELKEIDIKNRTRYYFDDIIKIEDLDFDNILSDQKSYENILVSAKPLRVRLNKVYGLIRVYDGTRNLVLFGPEKYDAIYKRIRYFIGQKIGITYAISHNYARLKTYSYNSFPPEKTWALHNVITLIKLVFDNDQNLYYYNIFLENCSCK